MKISKLTLEQAVKMRDSLLKSAGKNILHSPEKQKATLQRLDARIETLTEGRMSRV